MDEIQQYKIIYTETAVKDIEEKADYIAWALNESSLSETWYMRLRTEIQNLLSTMPYKYPSYNISPWKERGIRMFCTRNDVILYSVDEAQKLVYIRSVCTRGRDLDSHLSKSDS